nr:hypothetical protein DA06_23475 [Georgenia sp. SUBG003]
MPWLPRARSRRHRRPGLPHGGETAAVGEAPTCGLEHLEDPQARGAVGARTAPLPDPGANSATIWPSASRSGSAGAQASPRR